MPVKMEAFSGLEHGHRQIQGAAELRPDLFPDVLANGLSNEVAS
jgi:hypothetical protein